MFEYTPEDTAYCTVGIDLTGIETLVDIDVFFLLSQNTACRGDVSSGYIGVIGTIGDPDLIPWFATQSDDTAEAVHIAGCRRGEADKIFTVLDQDTLVILVFHPSDNAADSSTSSGNTTGQLSYSAEFDLTDIVLIGFRT